MVAHNGRYGPYVKCGEETRSLPDGFSPLDVTLEQALELLAQPKTRRGGAARKEPIKVFDASPVTGQPVRLMQGRYGPYVTDGVTNASLPRGTTPEEVTFEYALNLLKERAEAGPGKRAARKSPRPRPPKKAEGGRRSRPSRRSRCRPDLFFWCPALRGTPLRVSTLRVKSGDAERRRQCIPTHSVGAEARTLKS